MVIARIVGGLGNQMFCYAMARRLAHVRGTELKLDLSVYRQGADSRKSGLEAFTRTVGLHQLNTTASEASPAEIAALKDDSMAFVHRVRRRLGRALGRPSTHLVEKGYRFDPDVLTAPVPCYTDGFWQTEKYFADIADVIRAEFAPKDPAVLSYAEGYVAKLKQACNGPLVALHVRRGDLAYAQEQLKDVSLVHGAPVSLDYIYQAVAQFDPSAHFLVFSDSAKDIQWCRDNIKADRLHFSEGHTDVQDLTIMSRCDHNILANSTFSWWAAWLNPNPGKRVISPKVWAIQKAATTTFMVPDDLIPPSWVLL